MVETFATLKTDVAAALNDPDNLTFTDATVGNFVNAALAELGRVAPAQFQDDMTPVENQAVYALLPDIFVGEPNEDVEPMRVEIWDTLTQAIDYRYCIVPPAAQEYRADSQTGWSVWAGSLYLPNWVVRLIGDQTTVYSIRVWGYAPYKELTADADTIVLTALRKQAVLSLSVIEGLKLLNRSRELFSQWQTRSGNSDISPAGLMNALNMAQEDWRRQERKLQSHRAAI